MGQDYRSALYDRYVSTFKGAPHGEAAYAWWDHKYLPLLQGVGLDAPILEVGCGSGALLRYLAARGFARAKGIDISAEQVALARGLDVVRGDALQHLGAHPSCYECIVAVDVLEHFARDELLELSAGLHAALRPGGRLLVQTANGAGLWPGQVIYGDLTHQTIFTPGSLEQLLRNVGFDTFSFYETGPIPLRLRGRLDVVVWQAIKGAARAIKYVETGKRQTIWTENFICLAFKRA
jgi:SAM-dependent methyltransferase